MELSEHDIQTAIIKTFKQLGYFPVLRLNSGNFGGHSGFMVQGVPKGTPDIEITLKDGKSCFIEVKDQKGKPRPAQIEWHEKATQRNIIHGIARSVTDALNIAIHEEIGFGYELTKNLETDKIKRFS